MTCKHCGKGGQTFPYYIGLHGRGDIVSHVELHERCSPEWHRNWRENGMAFEHKDNNGSLFRNKEKKADKHPDHTGTAKIDGVNYKIAAWINEGNSGKYFRLKFERMDEQKPAEPAPQQDFQDDDVPF